MSGFNMDDYVPVNERIEAFYKQYPEGSIQGEIVELTETRVTVRALAYRNHEDTKPGVGHSSLNIPGSTTFTKGSEVENAETSAWGRAIAALGFEVKRGVASREEVRNKQSEPKRAPSPAVGVPPPAPAADDDLPPLPPIEDLEPPDELGPRIERARAKGQAQAEKVCPTHGADRVRTNKRGLYCATNEGTRDEPQWCQWSAAA
jgi:hypothetical protein